MSDPLKTVFIYTRPGDWNAVLAKAALKQRSHRVLRYFGTDPDPDSDSGGASQRDHMLA